MTINAYCQRNTGLNLILGAIFLLATVPWTKFCSGEISPILKTEKILWDSPWTHTCVQNTIDGPSCQRSKWNETAGDEARVPISVCLLTCGHYGALWPYPTVKVDLGQTLTDFGVDGIFLASVEAPTESIKLRLANAADLAFKNIAKLIPPEEEKSPFFSKRDGDVAPNANNNSVQIKLVVQNPDEKISFDVDETYALTTSSFTEVEGVVMVTVEILAPTYFGARHALETLVQLIAFNDEKGLFEILDTVSIQDGPTFRYRGLSMDTGRNFIPVKNLKKMIDGLSYNKMNVFHWHLTDSNSFPFLSNRVPQMTKYGIFTPTKVYTPADVTELVTYASDRGVKIIVELDAPAHAGNGWQWDPTDDLGSMTLCFDAPIANYKDFCIQPPCGQLDPLNNNTYLILGEIFKDLLEVFDSDYFHLGGDEISERCWLAYDHIQDWLTSHTPTNDTMELWGMYQNIALQKLKEANNNQPISAIVWTSEMTQSGRRFLNPADYIIQIWSSSNDPVIKEILEENYRVIFSNNDTMYLDHGYGPWRGTVNKATLKFWQHLYGHDILAMIENLVGPLKTQKMMKAGQILGGEATLWSEKSDAQNMEMKLWPRGFALAERLWSSPIGNQTRFAYPRLIHHRERMIQFGLQVDTLVPESCYHIWGFCDDPEGSL